MADNTKAQTDALKHAANMEFAAKLINNPAVEIMGTFFIVELLQKYGMLGSRPGTAIEVAITTIVACQQLAPLLPYAGEAVGESIAPIIKALPIAAMAAA